MHRNKELVHCVPVPLERGAQPDRLLLEGDVVGSRWCRVVLEPEVMERPREYQGVYLVVLRLGTAVFAVVCLSSLDPVIPSHIGLTNEPLDWRTHEFALARTPGLASFLPLPPSLSFSKLSLFLRGTLGFGNLPPPPPSLNLIKSSP